MLKDVYNLHTHYNVTGKKFRDAMQIQPYYIAGNIIS